MKYRNKIEITSYEGIIIEPGFLWRRDGELMVLVDEDQYVTTYYDAKKFNLAERNEQTD